MAKETFLPFKSNKNWFETLSVQEHDEAVFKLKEALIKKEFYKNIDLLSVLNVGEVSNRLIKAYSKDEIIDAMIEDSISNAIINDSANDEIGLALSCLIDNL